MTRPPAHDDEPREEVLADRRAFPVSDVWDGLLAALDRPSADGPGLVQLMNEPTVLDGR